MNSWLRKFSILYLTTTLFIFNFNSSNANIKDINGHWAEDKINNFIYNSLILRL